jgi:hypothetical protein
MEKGYRNLGILSEKEGHSLNYELLAPGVPNSLRGGRLCS